MNKTYEITTWELKFSHVDNKEVYLEDKIKSLFNYKPNGIFIELGGNDGLTQSNTASLEFYKGWRGVLIEPSEKAYLQCVKNRPNSICLNYACVSSDYKDEYIEGDFDGNMMSSVDGKRLDRNNNVKVKVITLEKICEDYNLSHIDLLSLDTEGYELNILKGLNLNRFRPVYMIIEVYSKDFYELCGYLEKMDYELICNFSNYNKIDNPRWDGTHNDYLFKDKRV